MEHIIEGRLIQSAITFKRMNISSKLKMLWIEETLIFHLVCNL